MVSIHGIFFSLETGGNHATCDISELEDVMPSELSHMVLPSSQHSLALSRRVHRGDTTASLGAGLVHVVLSQSLPITSDTRPKCTALKGGPLGTLWPGGWGESWGLCLGCSCDRAE